MGNKLNMIDEVRKVYECEFVNASTGEVADMSAAKLVSEWIRCDSEKLSVEAIWPATGTPIGTVGIEVTNHPAPAFDTEGTPYETDDFVNDKAPNQPDGSAGRTLIPLERIALWLRVTYAKTSGGAAATLQAYVALMQ